jgi:predicted hydrocarbon binding protein
MGALKVVSAGPDYGEVELSSSHLDQGWIKKWGKCDKPVNHIVRGFIASLFATALNRPRRTYGVKETASIVSGAPQSKFVVVVE